MYDGLSSLSRHHWEFLSMTKTTKAVIAGLAAVAVLATAGILAADAFTSKPVAAPKNTVSAVSGPEAVNMNGWTETGRRPSGGGP
jgi:hypothetical protein